MSTITVSTQKWPAHILMASEQCKSLREEIQALKSSGAVWRSIKRKDKDNIKIHNVAIRMIQECVNSINEKTIQLFKEEDALTRMVLDYQHEKQVIISDTIVKLPVFP